MNDSLAHHARDNPSLGQSFQKEIINQVSKVSNDKIKKDDGLTTPKKYTPMPT